MSVNSLCIIFVILYLICGGHQHGLQHGLHQDVTKVSKFEYYEYFVHQHAWFEGLPPVEGVTIPIGYQKGIMTLFTKYPAEYRPLDISCTKDSIFFADIHVISPLVLSFYDEYGNIYYIDSTPSFRVSLDIVDRCAGSDKYVSSLFIFPDLEHRYDDHQDSTTPVCQGLIKDTRECSSYCSPYLVTFEAIVSEHYIGRLISGLRVEQDPFVSITYYQGCR